MNNNYNIDDNRKIMLFNGLSNNNVINGFTLKPFNFRRNYELDEVIEENIAKLEDIFDYKFALRMQPVQTHTNNIGIVHGENLNHTFEDTDGLITDLKGILLTTVVADCQAILLYDSKQEVIGNIHSGWKGTLNRIIVNAINIMVDNYGSNVEDIQVYICPSILDCCFEVEDDVRNLFIEEFNDIDINSCIKDGGLVNNVNKYYIDTVKVNKMVLTKIGVKEENIVVADMCSKCNKTIMHSHRGDGPQSGRNLAFICMK